MSAATASAHLSKLVEAGLVGLESVGRCRYCRRANPDLSLALEALAVIAPPLPATSLRESGTAGALRRSRTCDDHLAGQLGVDLMQSLLKSGLLTGHDGTHRPEKSVRDRATGYGHDLDYRLTETGGRRWPGSAST